MAEEPAESMECDPYIPESWNLVNNYPRLERSDRISAIVYMTEENSPYGPADKEKLRNLYENHLGFKVKELCDPTRGELMSWVGGIISEINSPTGSEHDAFAFAFIGHGHGNGDTECMILKEEPGSANTFSVNELLNLFAYNCIGLLTIPKFFLFQLCRGVRREIAVPEYATAANVSPWSDIYCLFASPQGFVSWYDEDTGQSILVDAVCEVFLNNYQTQDLETMTNSVVIKITNTDINNYLQTPYIGKYKFTKRLYFHGIGGIIKEELPSLSRPAGSQNYVVCSATTARLGHEELPNIRTIAPGISQTVQFTEGDLNVLKLQMAVRVGSPTAKAFALLYTKLTNVAPGQTVKDYYKTVLVNRNFNKEFNSHEKTILKDPYWDSYKLEVTFVFKMLQKVCDLEWDKPGPLEDNLKIIKDVRNYVSHEAVTLDDKELQNKINELKASFTIVFLIVESRKSYSLSTELKKLTDDLDGFLN